MTAFSEQLVGVWSGNAFPTQETTVVFCPGGQGLLFFYLGSSLEPPFVDEFTWSAGADQRLHVRWLARHEYDPGQEEGDEDAPLLITAGAEETVSVEISGMPERALRTSLGMHDFIYANTWLTWEGPPGSFARERDRLWTLARDFDPFRPGRRTWIAGDGRWRKARPLADNGGRLGLSPTRLILSCMFFGATGQTVLWANPILTLTTRRGWILLPLLFLPLFGLFRESYFPGKRWHHLCLVLQMLLSATYLLAGVIGVTLALSPISSPAGRSMNVLSVPMTILGAVPCVSLLRTNPGKIRSGARTEPTLAETFRGWRDWRIHDMNVWLFFGIMTGAMSEMCFLLGHGPHWLTKWPRILLHCVPALMAVCDDDGPSARIVQKFSALWYFAVLALVIVAFGHGWRPSGWLYLAAGMMIGILPCISVWRRPVYVSHETG